MPRDRDPGALPPLRDRLTARGAKPHSRMSDLSRYMLDHRDELHGLLADGFAWADIAALLATEEGLVDKRGQPVTAALAKLTWSRISKRQRATLRVTSDRAGPVAGDGPMMAPHAADAAGMPTHPPPAVAVEKNQPPFASPDRPPLQIPTVRLRGTAATPLPAAVQGPVGSASSPLSEAEVSERIADLAQRQAGPKIPTPGLL